MQQTQPDPLPTGVEGADRRLQVRTGARAASDGERRLRRPDLEIRVDRWAAGPPPGSGRSDRPVRDGQGSLQRGEFVGRGVLGGGDGGRVDRGGAGPRRIVGTGPQACKQGRRTGQGGRKRDAVAGARDGQQVPLDGPADRLVAERDRSIAFDDEAVLDRLGEARSHVRVEHAVAVTGTARRAWCGPIRFGLVRVGHVGELLCRQWQARRRHQPQHPATLRRACGHARDDERLERVAQRGVRQLAASGKQFLRHKGQSTGSLHDQQQEAGRGAFALDALDQGGEVVAIERSEGQPLERPRRGGDRREVAGPRVVARHDVRLVRRDDREALVARDA